MRVTSMPSGFLYWALLAASIILSPPAEATPEHTKGSEALVKKGYLDVTRFAGVDPEGKDDSTDGLIKAIDYAVKNSLVAFFPAGTYLVSNTVRAEQRLRRKRKCGRKRNSVVIIGSTAGPERPLIRLADRSQGFDNPDRPKPVVHILTPKEGGGEDSACSFAQVFRGINIAVGKHNPGAVGIRFAAAQESSFEDVDIDATGAYAGVTAVPGRGMATVNIKIRGGKYGIDLKPRSGSLGGSLVGIVLLGQTERAIRSAVWNTLAVTGFLIEKDRGPVIETRSGHAQAGNLALTDGRIEVKRPGLIIDNRNEVFVQLNEVYFRGARELIRSGSQKPVLPAGNEWTVVRHYSYCPKRERGGFSSWNLIDGKRNQEEIVSVASSRNPPVNLVDRHIPHGIANFEDKDVVNAKQLGVKGDGETDDTKALQNAIDRYENIFLPIGNYLISDTLRLNKKTQLFGVPGLRTKLTAARSWRPSLPTWMIETVDNADAATVLADVSINPPANGSWLGALRWRAGRHSIVRSVPRAVGTKSVEKFPRYVYKVEGNGGGRWYRWQSHSRHRVNKKQSTRKTGRKLLVEGTTEPLTFYGFNPEHSWVPMVELRRAANVRILGAKSEHDAAQVLIIRESKNIVVAIFSGKRQRPGRPPFITVEGGTGIQISGAIRQGAHEPMLVDSESDASISADEYLSLYRRGEIDLNVWSGINKTGLSKGR